MKTWSLVLIVVLFSFTLAAVSGSRSLSEMIRGKSSAVPTLPRSSSDIDDKIVLASVDETILKGSSTISTSVFNLAKTILGAGVLSLPFGVAAFTDSPQGLIPAIILIVLMGIMSAYSFSSIGKACHEHSARSFSEAWSKSINPQTSGALNFIIIFKTFFACLAYSIIIG
ncbi:hypothetical protein EON65_03950 [archaeon]|nr:MAG: hypothetical protein EON65_03950 [archaeon]